MQRTRPKNKKYALAGAEIAMKLQKKRVLCTKVPQMLHQLLIRQAQVRIIEESVPRIERCLAMLSEGQIWMRPNPESNAVGNLVLHLCGNARQWILSGLCGMPDRRERSREFAANGEFDKEYLQKMLHLLTKDLTEAWPNISTEALIATHRVQVFDETGVSILVHVIEHFSYHTGQIAYITKWLTNTDTGFYAGQNLEIKP